MKKIIKIGSFILIFSLLFVLCQRVLHYRWSGEENLLTRNVLYSQEPQDSIDVIFLGTSEVYSSVFPAAIYDEVGITSINFGISYISAVTSYYQLKYALKYQTPQAVICDFSALYENCNPDINESIYRKVADTMPDKKIKFELVKDICKFDENASFISYYLPLLRYHGMWDELTEENFRAEEKIQKSYPLYLKGALLVDREYSPDDDNPILNIDKELWLDDSQSGLEINEVSAEYYEKMIDLCNEKGIILIAYFPPKVNDIGKQNANWDKTSKWLADRNVKIENCNTWNFYQEVGLDLWKDYYNVAHVNRFGAEKCSRYLGNVLMNKYGIKGNESEEVQKTWNTYWNEYQKDYLME